MYELIRYIHLNPLRAGKVSDLAGLEEYAWSGHSVLMGKAEHAGQEIDGVLLFFGKRLSAARRNYRKFIADGVLQGRRPELVGGGLRRSQKATGGSEEIESFDDRVLGSGDFVDSLRQDARIRDQLRPRVSLGQVQTVICDLFEVEPRDILRRTRRERTSEARAVFCYTASRMCGIIGVEIGDYLSMGSSAVSRAVARGEKVLRSRVTIKMELESRLKH